MDDEPTKSVKLTLQEIDYIHSQMTNLIVRSDTKGFPMHIDQWFFELHKKLGKAKDKLMGKK